jgi:hypothetical protein
VGRSRGNAAAEIGLFSVPVVVGLVTSRLIGGDWNWAPAIFFGVPIGGAAVLGRRERRKRGA